MYYIESNSVINRFKSANDYADYMLKKGYADGFHYFPLGIETGTDEFKMEYYRREWYRCQTIKTLFSRIEALEKMLNSDKNDERSATTTAAQ